MKFTYDTISQLQLKSWEYTEADRQKAVYPRSYEQAPRFVKQGNMYVNPAASNTGRARLLLAGDQMCQEKVIAAKKKKGLKEDYDFKRCYRHLRRLFQKADLSIGNLETTVHPEAPYANEQLFIGKYYNRNCPPQYLEALRFAGFDLLTTANNHMLDSGMRGLYRTCELLDSFGFVHTGSFFDTEAPRFALVNVNGIRVGVLSYTSFYNFPASEYVSKEGISAVLNLYSKGKACKDVADLRAAGAEYIICYMHWGAEMVHTVTDWQRRVAKELANAGVDYIAGSHAHVIQPYDIISADDGRSVPVIYSMGNLLCHFTKKAPKTSVIIELTLIRNADGTISTHDSYIPCYVFDKFDGWKYSIVPMTNKKYLYESTNATIQRQKDHAASVIGNKIKLCHSFDEAPVKQQVPKSTKPQIIDRDFHLQKATGLQLDFMDAYRLSDEFRWLYGEYIVDHYATGESVSTAISVIKRLTNTEEVTTKTHRKLIADMVYTKLVLGFAFWEYFVYGLADKTPLERTEFLPQRNNVDYYRKLNTSRESINKLNNKYLAYETFKPYYKREILKVSGAEQREAFINFVSSFPRFIAKPINASIGKGVQLFDIKNYASASDMFSSLLQHYVIDGKTPFLCEELIVADPVFASIHPESINSLRIFTYNNGTEASIVCAWLKAGRGSAVIDNGSSGGMLAAIDCSTGTVCSPARDENNTTFHTHPDTGFVFQGFKIDRWEEAVAIAKEMSGILPGMRCIGWDIALSAEKGWQIIEGNAFGMVNVLQVATQKGMRKDFLNSVEWDLYK